MSTSDDCREKLRSVSSSLKERVQQILERHGWNAGQLASKAGLHRTHVYSILQKPNPRPDFETVDAIARAGGVDLYWLCTGRGEPGYYRDPLDADDPYRGRSEAAHHVQALGLLPLDAVRDILVVDEPENAGRSVQYWFRRMELRAAERRLLGPEKQADKA